MEELNATVFNHEITLMRKHVARGKVHLINKLTRLASKLKEKKGKEEIAQKNKKKANSLIEQVHHGKNLKKDDISRFILSYSEDELNKFVNNSTTTPDIKFQAKLALLDGVKGEIKKFHEKYPNWNEILPSLLGRKTKKKKKKKKLSRKNKENGKEDRTENQEENMKKQRRFSIDKFNGWTVTNDQSINSEGGDLEDKDIDAQKEASTLIMRGKEEKSKSVEDLEESEDDSEHDDDDDDDDLSDSDGSISDVGTLKSLKPNLNDNGFNKLENYIKENQINFKEMPSDLKTSKIEKPKKFNPTPEKIDDKRKEKANIRAVEKPDFKLPEKTKEKVFTPPVLEIKKPDPFFMTRDNKEYIPNCDLKVNVQGPGKKIKRQAMEMEESETASKSFISNNKNSLQRRSDWANQGNKFPKFDKNSRQGNKFSKFEGRPTERKKFQKNDASLSKGQIKLHPSWEAKKKQSVATAPFQGKKIVFDD